MSCPRPNAEEKRKTPRPDLHPIKRWPATGDTKVSALLGSGKSRAADSRLQIWPEKGRSLADKGAGEKVRDATPKG